MKLRSYEWLHDRDQRILRWFNRRRRLSTTDRLLNLITHLGGAVFTIALTLSIAWFAPEPWSRMGWQSLAALSASFLITTMLKKKMRRIRPYLALTEIRVGRNPLKDPSFPSGHSTAIFSIITPFLFVSSWLSVLLLALALTVSISRIYLGLHYPSDCAVGCLVGTATALLVGYLF